MHLRSPNAQRKVDITLLNKKEGEGFKPSTHTHTQRRGGGRRTKKK